jgi:vacuolar-type H+-ATPase subunit H
MVNGKNVMELLDQLKLAVPQDIKAAQEIIHKKDAIINQAQIEARRIRSSAEQEFSDRVGQSEVINTARRQAEEMLEDAKHKVDRMMVRAGAESKATQRDSDAYARQALNSLERQLATVLTTVRKGMEELENGHHS